MNSIQDVYSQLDTNTLGHLLSERAPAVAASVTAHAVHRRRELLTALRKLAEPGRVDTMSIIPVRRGSFVDAVLAVIGTRVIVSPVEPDEDGNLKLLPDSTGQLMIDDDLICLLPVVAAYVTTKGHLTLLADHPERGWIEFAVTAAEEDDHILPLEPKQVKIMYNLNVKED
jgi:hypothetical protein